MESGLKIAELSRTLLQDLLPTTDTSAAVSSITVLQQEEDTASSVYHAPPLPRTGDRVKFLVYPSESERTGDEKSLPITHLQRNPPRDSESGKKGGDEFGFEPVPTDPAGPSISTGRRPEFKMQKPSGQSRALF